jgi:hypothetical protein
MHEIDPTFNSTNFTKELSQIISDAKLAEKRKNEKETLKVLQKQQGTVDSSTSTRELASQEKTASSIAIFGQQSQQLQAPVTFNQAFTQSQILTTNNFTTLTTETTQPRNSFQLRDIGNIIRTATDFVNLDEDSNTCHNSPFDTY